MSLAKRSISVAVALLCVSVVTSGCTDKISKHNLRVGTAPNEVISLTPIPEDKIVFTMRTGDNMDDRRIEAAIEAKVPEVELVLVRNTSMRLDSDGGGLQDILLTSEPNEFRDAPPGSFVDLSAEDFLANYNLSALNNCAIDGKIYYLPGPYTVCGIVYDKELFAENGWEIPSSLDEFIELCKTINATGIRALQPSIQYLSSARQLFVGFSYLDCFAGVDNYQWLEDFTQGKSTMKGHMEPGLEIMQRLLEAGVWSTEDFTVSPRDRTNMMYHDHSCAMIIESQMAPNYAKETGKGNEHEIGMMPFFSGNRPGSDFLIANPSFSIGINAKLEEKGDEERLQKALDILEYISTPDGQQAIINEETPLISNVIGTPPSQSTFLANVQKTIDEGRIANIPYYFCGVNSTIDKAFFEQLQKFSEGTVSAEEMLSACDAARDELLAGNSAGVKIGDAAEDFTVLEMSLYLAESFRERAGAQIGLCPANKRLQGCNTRLYAGEIYDEARFRSFGQYLRLNLTPAKDETTLIKVSMTGQNLLDALEKSVASAEESPNCYMAAAGLKIEFAPWAGTGKHIVSVKLSDGSELKPDEIYTVASWQNVLDEADIVSTDETYTDSITSIFAQKVQKDGGTIKPFKDDRFILNWNILP